MKSKVKKIMLTVILFAIVMGVMSMFSSVFAVTGEEVLQSEQATELLEIKESAKSTLDDYVIKYGSYAFGLAAYILNIVRIYSIPLCFVGIAYGSVYQYVLGVRKLDVRDRGFMLIITFVTVLMICQVLPLVFAVIVSGWRG